MPWIDALLALLGRPAEAALALQGAAASGQLSLWVGVDPVFDALRGRPDFEWALSNQAPG